MEKKGISTIIATIIMIVLVLGAVGIIWTIVGQILEGGVEDINLGQKCLKINLEAKSLNCDGTTCTVNINRKTGGEDFAGVKLVFSNSDEETIGSVQTVPGNIAQLETQEKEGIGVSEADTVEITVYFLDSSDNEQICSQTKKFTF